MTGSGDKIDHSIWALTSGASGMRSQALGLANAVAADNPSMSVIEKQFSLRPLWRLFPGHLTPVPFYGLTADTKPLTPPWPKILITSGRRSAALSIAIGRASNGKTYRVHIQDPKIPAKYFDLIASMAHDSIRGDNVVLTKTAVHKLTKKDLSQAATIWRPELVKDGDGLVLGLVLGGKNKKFGFDKDRLADLVNLINTAIQSHNARALITPSRRTEQFVKDKLKNLADHNQNIWFWDETGDNPYLAILELADHLCVTADSVSMISEGLYTSKPVHIFPLGGISRRHSIFINGLVDNNLAAIAKQEIDFSVHKLNHPIDETSKVAEIINRNMSKRAEDR